MGFARRMVRKSVRKATPRAVRQVAHPVRTMKSAVTPRPVKQLSRAVYTVTNPLGAAQNAVIDAVLNPPRPSGRRSGGMARARTATHHAAPATVTVGGGVRAAEALESCDRIAALMAVQRQRFDPAARPVIPAPAAVEPTQFYVEEWAAASQLAEHRKIRFWQRARRQLLKADVGARTIARAQEANTAQAADHAARQAEADRWWTALNRGDKDVVTAALTAAFADNPAPVVGFDVDGDEAGLIVLLPGIDVLPDRQAHVTPTGRLSSKAWTKTDLQETYAGLLGAHLLATIRETWAVAPSLTKLRVIGMRRADPLDVLFDVDVDRGEAMTDDRAGDRLLAGAQWGLHRTGRTQEVSGWPAEALRPDVRLPD